MGDAMKTPPNPRGAEAKRLGKLINDAAERGSLSRLKKLIAAGCPPTLTHPHTGYRPLISAAAKGRSAVVKYLLSLGVDVDQKVDYPYPEEDQDATALMRASQSGHRGMVQILLKAGADVNANAAMKGGPTA